MKRKAQQQKRTEAYIPVFMRPTKDQGASTQPSGHPCPAQETIKRLCQQVALLERKQAYLQTLLFKVMAAQISGGDLASSVYAWLDCDQCREELACLVEESTGKKVH